MQAGLSPIVRSPSRRSRALALTQQSTLSGIHWLRTLTTCRDQPLTSEHLRYQRTNAPVKVLHCFVIDVSASMMRAQQLAMLKGLMIQWSAQIYRDRDALAAIAFGGRGARVLRGPCMAASDDTHWIEAIEGGGGTPVREALELADAMLCKARRTEPMLHCVLWLLSDVRFVQLPNLPRHANTCRVVDFDTGPMVLSRATRLARRWGIRHEHASDWIQPMGTSSTK